MTTRWFEIALRTLIVVNVTALIVACVPASEKTYVPPPITKVYGPDALGVACYAGHTHQFSCIKVQ